MPDLSSLLNLLTIALILVTLAAILGTLAAGALGVARWARGTGRRPWLWVIGAYLAINVAIGLIELLVRGPR